MPKDTPPPLVDVVKASASKLKEKQAALDARAKELDALKARLEAERADLDTRAKKMAADEEAIAREKQGLGDVRADLERDLAAINEGRERLKGDEVTLQRALKALEEREKTVKADEERVQQLEEAFAGPMKDAESRLHELVEHERELTSLEKDWLTSFEAREQELRTITDQMHARQAEALQQHESLSGLRNELTTAVERLLQEQEKLAAKEKTLLDAEAALASALQFEDEEIMRDEPPAEPAPTPAPVPPEPAAAPLAPEPAPQPEPEPVTAPVVSVQEEPPEEPEKPRLTKSEATERLARAVEAWKRARDSGWKVTDIRKTVKAARDALESGEYERVERYAAEILEGLQAIAK